MKDEDEAGPVRVWRPAGADRILLMEGWTGAYAVEPRGEYFIGAVGGSPMRAARGRTRHTVRPGDLVVWDPSSRHSGRPAADRAWYGRLLVVEMPDVATLLGGDDDPLVGDVEFPRPVVRDAALAAAFDRMHRVLARPDPGLAHETVVTEWLPALAARSPSVARRRQRAAARREPAVRLAVECLMDNLRTGVSLEELARVAGVGRYRLVRLFRAALGMPPHQFLLAQRVRLARRLLERGMPIAEVAGASGFADQSHLHRHFRRALGVTPGRYAEQLAKR